MYQSCNGSSSAVVDICHGARNGSCDGHSAKKWRNDVCHSLRHEFHIGIVPVSGYAISNGCRKQRLDGPQHGNGKSRREKQTDTFEIKRYVFCFRQIGIDGKPIANGFYAANASIRFHQIHHNGH